jgi:hypothetical protein
MGYLINYNNELFPVSVRGFSLGSALFMGRMLMSVFPFMNSMLDAADLHRLTPVVFSSLATLIISLTLPETQVKKLD